MLSCLPQARKSGTISVMRRIKSLYDAYAFPGFRTLRRLKGLFGDRFARIVVLKRRGKKPAAGPAALSVGPTTTAGGEESATCPVASPASTWSWNCVVSGAATAAP
jgi:hypothetical protein